MTESGHVCRLDLYRQLNLPLPNVPSPTCQGGEQQGPVRCKRAMGGNEGPLCRRDILKQMGLPIPGEEGAINDMETTVASLEHEVRTIQTELDTVQAERRQLEMQKRLLHCAAPTLVSSPCRGVKPNLLTPAQSKTEKSTQISKTKVLPKRQNDEGAELKDLDNQYNDLVKDYNAKVEEISSLRVEVDVAKRQSIAATKKREQAKARLEDLEARLRAFEDDSLQTTGNKDRMIELTQQLAMAERMFEKSMEEYEDYEIKARSQTQETDEFRRKYLDNEQRVEEQRHKIEMLELERTRLGEEVTQELKNIKAQFQSKLEEMTLLPELINKTNEKLKETEQLKTIAEKNCVIISMNFDEAKAEKDALQKQLDMVNKNRNESEAENCSMKCFLTDGEKKMEETKNENKTLKFTVARLEEVAVINERKYEEAVEEGKLLKKQLETLRQQSARQVAKTKDRFDKTRHTLQDQVADLEKSLASTRALQKTSLKERDEIRQKMQCQIVQINENFEQAQKRIRSIQSHVNYLKTSYSNSSGNN